MNFISHTYHNKTIPINIGEESFSVPMKNFKYEAYTLIICGHLHYLFPLFHLFGILLFLPLNSVILYNQLLIIL